MKNYKENQTSRLRIEDTQIMNTSLAIPGSSGEENHREGINGNWDQDDKAEDVGVFSVVTAWLYFLEEDSFLDLVKALEFKLHKDCQMERAVISAPSLNSPKTGTWTKAAFDSITSKVKHVTQTRSDLAPIFKDCKKYLANIKHGNSGSNNYQNGTNKILVETQSLSLFGSNKLQQESSFLFHDSKTKATSEKKVKSVSEKKMDPLLGVTDAFARKLMPLLVKLWPPDWIFIFPWQTSFFGKNITQSKPVSLPFFTKTLVSQAENGRNECKGRDKGRDDEPPKIVITQVKGDAFYSKNYKLFYKKMNLKRRSKSEAQHLVQADTNLGNILLNVLIPPITALKNEIYLKVVHIAEETR
eukprot:bmy_07892T0